MLQIFLAGSLVVTRNNVKSETRARYYTENKRFSLERTCDFCDFVSSSKLNNKRELARLITQYRDIFFSNISEGTAFLLQGVTETLKKEGRAFRNIGKNI